VGSHRARARVRRQCLIPAVFDRQRIGRNPPIADMLLPQLIAREWVLAFDALTLHAPMNASRIARSLIDYRTAVNAHIPIFMIKAGEDGLSWGGSGYDVPLGPLAQSIGRGPGWMS